MNKLRAFWQRYLFCGLPFVIATMVWSSIFAGAERAPTQGIIVHTLWEVLSWNLMLWFAALIGFFVVLVFSPRSRDEVLKGIANVRDRDEREEYITGRASKADYIATLSLLILFLFLSIFQLNIQRVTAAEAIAGRRGTVTIGLNMKLLDKVRPVAAPGTLFDVDGLPLSKSALLLCLIGWQLLSFRVSARRLS